MRTIGRYPLVTRLASGTLGDVFLAQAEPSDGAHVAIKLIRPDLALDPRIARLVQIEGQTAGQFSHPVFVPVHEAERDGLELFIASDLIGGQPLSSVLKKLRVEGTPLDHRLICHVGAEVASLLDQAHVLPWFPGAAARFLHGTLSPKRILLGYEGDTRLLGLGWGRARMTQPLGMAALPFASPEVVARREPTPRSDIYSLGAVLYYAFSGRPIFRRGDETATRAAIREANAPPLNSATLTIDPAIGDLIAEMMAPRVEARPESMSTIEEKLRAASGLSREDASAALATLVQSQFAVEAEAFGRMTKAATRAAQPKETPRRKFPPREESRLVEVPKAPWSTNDMEPLEGDPADTVGVPSGAAEGPPGEPEGNAGVTEPDRPSPFGLRIARYVIERPISRSSTTVVHECRDPNVARSLMVKTLNPRTITDPRLGQSEWVRLFKVEARIAGRLRHEGFPILYDAGRDEGVYFIAFESIPGDTLMVRQDRGERFAPSQVKRIAIDLARALHYLHQFGLVHGDVKASNVLLGDDGRSRLIDFSLASYLEGPQHPLLAANLVVASPELLDGGSYTPQAEQFALGALLYALLVGSRPFRGMDDGELARSIRETAPRPPEALEEGVDPILSEACMRLLEKDPMARFEDLGAFAARLEATGPDRPRDLLDHDTEPMIRMPSDALEAANLAETLVRMCERVSTLAAPDFVHRAISDAPAMARSLARRLGLDDGAQMRGALAVAIRDVADRARLSIQSEEMMPLVPRSITELVLAVDRVGDDGDSEALTQIVAVVEAYFRATRPRDGRPRSSPRRAVLELREQVGSRYSSDVVEALIEHLREVVSALDLSAAPSDPPRILVAGLPGDALMHALEFDGFTIEEVADGHAAWERLRKDAFSGAIVDAALPGRDGLSLLKLCRAHPDTAEIAFLIIGGEGLTSELEGVSSAAALGRTAALESIRVELGRLMQRGPAGK